MTNTLTPPATPDQSAVRRSPATFEEFLAWSDEDTRAEWVDGEIVPMAPASLEHQEMLDFLNDLVKHFVRQHQLGRVYFAPVLMRLPSRPSGREPDLLFVAAAHADRLRETYIDGPADLVVEIVSAESDARDHGEKFVEYEAAGIPEYWLIDPLRQEALFYQRGSDGRFHPSPVDADGVYRSAVLPGFWLKTAWLWQRPLPTLTELLQQIQA